jgi:hypothetical protein
VAPIQPNPLQTFSSRLKEKEKKKKKKEEEERKEKKKKKLISNKQHRGIQHHIEKCKQTPRKSHAKSTKCQCFHLNSQHINYAFYEKSSLKTP